MYTHIPFIFLLFQESNTLAIPESLGVKEIHLNAPEQKVFNGQPFPLILTPAKTSLQTIEGSLEWIRNNKHALEDLLLKYGAILFRNFPVGNPEDFDKFVKSFDYEPLPYVGGAAPRKVVVGNVFTANEAPPDQLIPFHHEMAQVPTFPKTLYFYCDDEPREGGQTPLVVSNEVYKEMLKREHKFVEDLESKGVVYNRVLPTVDDPTSPIGRGWQSTYQTNDKEQAEEKCIALGTTFEWMENGCLKTKTAVLPALRVDTRTGKKTWFNSVIAAYLGWNDVRNDAKKAVTFPDGTQMPENAMKTLEETFDRLAIDFTWRKGDVVMIDNRQVLHGRRSFTPPRRILATLCK